MSVLVKLEATGLDINPYMKQLLASPEIPTSVLKVIAQHQGLEAINFYEMLRKNHNQKKSPLYKNIISASGAEEFPIEQVITTLTSLALQITLYSNKLFDAGSKQLFLTSVRINEILSTLQKYYTEADIVTPIKLLSAIRTDLLVLEYIAGRRELR